jgi:CRP/FNR family transcriptional regulator, cyclic AMP receptor protein
MTAPTLINRSFADEPHLAELAVELLRSPQALPELSVDDAKRVIAYTRLLRVSEGEVLTREGEPAGNGFMLLLIDGEVTVDKLVPSQAEPVVVSVLGPGHLIGETALIDGGPRTATCTATTDIIGAGLSRNAVLRLVAADPEVAVKLMAGISVRMAQRLRAVNRQHRLYHQLLTAMQGEIDALQRQLQQVVDGSLARAQRQPEG